MNWLRHVLAVVVLAAALVVPAAAPRTAVPTTTTLYAVGDSITAGWGAGYPPRTYPAVLDDRYFGEDRSRTVTIGHPGQCLVAAGCGYTPLVQTWAPEVLNAAPTPTTVVLEIGSNDLGHTDEVTMETALLSLVQQATARGIRVIVGTITPRSSSMWTTYWTWGPEREHVNAWIRSTFGVNVADFDKALAQPDTWARPEAMSSDAVHPNIYGAADMAYCVPLAQVV